MSENTFFNRLNVARVFKQDNGGVRLLGTYCGGLYFPKDGGKPFTIVETSQGNYQTWTRLQSDKEFLSADNWHLIHLHLRKKYDADNGAGGAGHAFRLPLPGAYSHKRAVPFMTRVIVNDTEPIMSVSDILSLIPQTEKERNIVHAARSLAALGNWEIGDVEVPGWFREKWERRRSALLASPACPLKTDGTTPDWSSIEYRVALESLYGYKNRSEEQHERVASWLVNIVSGEAAKRCKPKPDLYAQRTVYKAANQLGLAVVRGAAERQASDQGCPSQFYDL